MRHVVSAEVNCDLGLLEIDCSFLLDQDLVIALQGGSLQDELAVPLSHVLVNHQHLQVAIRPVVIEGLRCQLVH
jgi:hypothetical protein